MRRSFVRSFVRSIVRFVRFVSRVQALRHVGSFKDYILGDEAAECLSARLVRESRRRPAGPAKGGRSDGATARSMEPRDEILKFDDFVRKRKKRGGGEGGEASSGGRKRGSSSSSSNAGEEGGGGGKRRFAMRPPAMTRERRADMASAETLNVGGELRAVLRTLESGRYEAFPPCDLLKSVWKLVPAFAGNEQQDAHEFMRFLLDRLKKELNGGRHAVDMRGVVTPRQKEHSPSADGIPNPPTRARSVRSRSGRSSPSPSFLRDDDGDDDASTRMREAIAGGATPVNGRVNRRGVDDAGDEDGGFVIVSRWGAKRHKMGCACRPCKSRRRREEEGGGIGKAKGASGAVTHLSSPTSSFASPSRLSRGVTASEVKKQLEETMRGARNSSLPSTPVVTKNTSETASSDKIMDMFGGVSITRITCMKCENTNERREPFMDLSLPIPPVISKNGSVPSTPLSPSTEPEHGEGPNGEVTLQQCLAAFVRNETLSGHGRYFCDACGKVQNATKSTRIAKLPEVLSLHLKRFTWKGHESRTKLTNDVDFPLEDLDLAPYCELDVVSDAATASEAPPASPDRSKARRTPRRSASAAAKSDCLYDLIAVVTHHGTSAGSGHYTACCRDVSSPSTNDWQHFNDDEVNLLTAEEVRTGQGYIFLYARKPKIH